jgi:anthranilate phosphoribosyltransferase
MFQDILTRLLARQDLSRADVARAMDEIMQGAVSPPRLAAFLTALRLKGETAEEVAGAAESMRRHALFIDAGARTVVDTCGTGGDGANTFNISTASAFVAAGAGVCVAKHGNRAVSSRCGSADVLAALGVNLEAGHAVMEQCLQEHGIGFLFAPRLHPAMKHAMPVRRDLAFRTVFNVLGPLTNPAGATGQVLGVYAPHLVEMLAQVLRLLGARRALVVHGLDGLDEITVCGRTRVCELRDGTLRTGELSAELLFGEAAAPGELAGGEPERNAEILRAILEGREQGAPRRVVLVNAAAALVAGEKADRIEDALPLAAASIDSGAARAKLEALVAATR